MCGCLCAKPLTCFPGLNVCIALPLIMKGNLNRAEAHRGELPLKWPPWAWWWVMLHSGLLKSPSKELLLFLLFFSFPPLVFKQLASNCCERRPRQQCWIEHDSAVTKLERGLGLRAADVTFEVASATFQEG